MDKGLCLEFVKLSTNLPPVYTHPYHKLSFYARPSTCEGLTEKISRFNKLKSKLNEQETTQVRFRQKYRRYAPKMTVSIVTKLTEQYSRPISCPTAAPKVFIEMNFKMLSPKMKTSKLHVRGNSIS